MSLTLFANRIYRDRKVDQSEQFIMVSCCQWILSCFSFLTATMTRYK